MKIISFKNLYLGPNHCNDGQLFTFYFELKEEVDFQKLSYFDIIHFELIFELYTTHENTKVKLNI